MKDTLNQLLFLLRKSSIQIDPEELEFQLLSHPTYPSLHSLTTVLDHFKIDNIAANVPVNNETLELLPTTFLAQINERGEEQLIIVEKGDNRYKLQSSSGMSLEKTKQEFVNVFTGVMLAVERGRSAETSEKRVSSKMIARSLLFF